MAESQEQKARMKREQWHETETPDVHHIQNEDVTHEESDVNVRGILWFVAGLAILTAVSFGLMRGLFLLFEKQAEWSEPAAAPLARKGKDLLPPEPRLQLAPGHEIHPLEELKELRRKDKEELTTYGEGDPGSGTVRLPIKVAEQKFLASNPPVRPQPQQNTTDASAPSQQSNDLFMEMPSYYSSGRATEKRRQ